MDSLNSMVGVALTGTPASRYRGVDADTVGGSTSTPDDVTNVLVRGGAVLPAKSRTPSTAIVYVVPGCKARAGVSIASRKVSANRTSKSGTLVSPSSSVTVPGPTER